MTRAHEDGLSLGPANYSVRQAVEDWLAYGQLKAGSVTRQKNRHLCETHVLPHLGARKLRELTAVEVDRWLHSLSKSLSTSSLRSVRACLNRAVRRAMARDLVQRNVVELCQVPHGRAGRPSKSLSLEQARGVLTRTVSDPLHAYIVVSLLTGARTEELRALRWEHVHLDPPQGPASSVGPPYVEVWRSVRANSETKTKKSRRTLALPSQAVAVLRAHRVEQMRQQLHRGITESSGLVFTTSTGAALDAANVRRDFRRALALVPGIDPQEWTPSEMRHSFVSLLSDSGVPIEEISRLVGHAGTHVTELVYRHQLRPVIESGAVAMERLFASDDEGDESA